MPLPNSPSTWDITAGGTVGVLVVQGTTGAVSGTIFGNPFHGFFDDTSQTLILIQNPQVQTTGGFSNSLVTPFTVYQGVLFQFVSGTTTFSVLSGTFTSNAGTGTPAYTAWYAQNPAPTKVGKEGKDGKDHKDGKEGKEHVDKAVKEVEKQVVEAAQILGMEPFAPDHAIGPLPEVTDAAIGQSFIGTGERPAVGTAALQNAKRLE